MTFRTGFDTYLITFYRTSSFESISTWTDDIYHLPCWVDIAFHKNEWLRVIANRSVLVSRKDTSASCYFLWRNNKPWDSILKTKNIIPTFEYWTEVVPRKRLELLHRTATASKTVVSTNSTTWAEKTNGGPGRIRTYEVVDKGFTVLPIWPLWNRPRKKVLTLRILDFRYCFLPKSNIPNIKTPENGATNQTWTDDRRFTKPMLYQLSYGGARADNIKNRGDVKIFLLIFYSSL